MARSFVQYLAIHNMINNIIKICTKICRILNKASKFRQSGEIWPNLVTLSLKQLLTENFPAILPGRPEGRLSTTTSPDCKDCLDDEMDDDDAARPAPTSPASTVDVVAPPSYEESPPAVPDFFVSGEGLEKNCNQSWMIFKGFYHGVTVNLKYYHKDYLRSFFHLISLICFDINCIILLFCLSKQWSYLLH